MSKSGIVFVACRDGCLKLYDSVAVSVSDAHDSLAGVCACMCASVTGTFRGVHGHMPVRLLWVLGRGSYVFSVCVIHRVPWQLKVVHKEVVSSSCISCMVISPDDAYVYLACWDQQIVTFSVRCSRRNRGRAERGSCAPRTHLHWRRPPPPHFAAG
jgi:hypothetical protein